MGTIYLAGGCFWGLQKFFDQFGGVIRTEAGYANGPDTAPSYQDVCRNSGHAETVRVDYDDKEMALAVSVEPIRNFVPAEEYHQKYLDKNPGCYCHIPRSFFSMEHSGKRKEEELRRRIGDLAYVAIRHAATETPYTVRHIAYPQSD